MYPVKFYPIPVPRVWGGHELKGVFDGKCKVEMPVDRVGEYWVLSGHPNGTSVVSNGPLQGRTLVELTEEFPEHYLGRSPQPRFPLLIKFLEASDDLSVQVHPEDAYAQDKENDFGKTEAWYVLSAPEDGKVVYGHHFANSEQLFDAAKEGTIQNYLDYQSIRSGDTVFVPATTLHALLAGTQVIEVQQTSDVTYRVYDWNRPGVDGKPRALHLDKAADALFSSPARGKVPRVSSQAATETPSENVLPDRTPQFQFASVANTTSPQLLASCAYFSIFKIVVPREQNVRIDRQDLESPDILIGAGGSLTLTYQNGNSSLLDKRGLDSSATLPEQLSVDFGETVLIPASLPHVELACATDNEATFLLVRY